MCTGLLSGSKTIVQKEKKLTIVEEYVCVCVCVNTIDDNDTNIRIERTSFLNEISLKQKHS